MDFNGPRCKREHNKSVRCHFCFCELKIKGEISKETKDKNIAHNGKTYARTDNK